MLLMKKAKNANPRQYFFLGCCVLNSLAVINRKISLK